MTYNEEATTVKVETIDDSRSELSKEGELDVETITPEYIQLPSQEYGNGQQTLDAQIALRNLKSSADFSYLNTASGSQTIANSTEVQVTNFTESKTVGTSTSISSNAINILKDGVYGISFGAFIDGGTTSNIILKKNSSNKFILRGYNSTTQNSGYLVLPLVATDVIYLYVYHNKGSDGSCQLGNLSVLKLA